MGVKSKEEGKETTCHYPHKDSKMKAEEQLNLNIDANSTFNY